MHQDCSRSFVVCVHVQAGHNLLPGISNLQKSGLIGFGGSKALCTSGGLSVTVGMNILSLKGGMLCVLNSLITSIEKMFPIT